MQRFMKRRAPKARKVFGGRGRAGGSSTAYKAGYQAAMDDMKRRKSRGRRGGRRSDSDYGGDGWSGGGPLRIGYRM